MSTIEVDVPAGPPVLTPGAARALLEVVRSIPTHQPGACPASSNEEQQEAA